MSDYSGQWDQILRDTVEWHDRRKRQEAGLSPSQKDLSRRGGDITTDAKESALLVMLPTWLRKSVKEKARKDQLTLKRIVKHSLLLYLRGEIQIPADE